MHFKQKSEVSEQNFLHNGFSDYFLFCTKRGAFIHEQRSDRSRPIMRTFKKRKKECTLYEYLKKKNSAKDKLGIHCPVSCMMLKVVNLHQKPRKNRSQRKLELKYHGKILKTEPKIPPQTQCHFFLPDRPKNCSGMVLCDIVTFQTVKQNLQHSRFFFGNKKLVFTVQDKRHYRSTLFFPIHVQLGKTTDL